MSSIIYLNQSTYVFVGHPAYSKTQPRASFSKKKTSNLTRFRFTDFSIYNFFFLHVQFVPQRVWPALACKASINIVIIMTMIKK